MESKGTVEGQRGGGIILYALSTCGWCRKTRELLDRLGLSYRFFYLDLLQGEERRSILARLRDLNPSESFPTIEAGDEVIVGFDEARIRGIAHD